MADGKQLLVAWLNDAHAVEKGIVEALESQVKVAEDHPMVQSGIQRHLEETKRHVELVEQCLDELGERPSALKSGVASVGAKVQALMMSSAEDDLVKASLNDYATEHMEIASYKALRVAAQELGYPAIADTCGQIILDEEAMATWLDENLPTLVREAVTEGGT
ncbi:MAG TPA: ferritin-like domain-containing protein [Thermomicrobiales bacterium]|nr:ferritin-like domain-containing protein [Thermomicrobiales bacterium]